MTTWAFDSDAFQHCSGLDLTAGPVKKLGPVLLADRPSDLDRVSLFAGTVVRLDDGRLRAYYSCVRNTPHRYGLAVAESNDGLDWTKPKLGQMRIQGQDSNRLRIAGLEDEARVVQPSVVRLPDGRWRMYFWLHGHERGHMRYLVAESDDGLGWSTLGLDKPVVYHPSDLEVGQNGWVAGLTQAAKEDAFAEERTLDWMDAKRLRSNDATYVYHDEAAGQFEIYSVWLLPTPPESSRYVPHDNAPNVLRTIHRRTSTDGLEWGAPELIVAPDANDPADMQFYYLAVHRERDWRVGFLGHYRCWEQTMDIELCFSQDGRRWNRPLRTGWIPRGPVPETDCMSAYATSGLIDAGDAWLMLYTAGNVKHNHEVPAGVENPTHAVMAASVPKGRFAALATTRGIKGRTMLKPFIPTSERVTVNAAVRGRLRVELCDPFGTPIPGYEFDKSVSIQGDAPHHELQWQGGKTTAPYRYDAVSLRLELDDGEVYAIQG